MLLERLSFLFSAVAFWLNAQKAVDLFRAERSLSKLPSPVLQAG